MTYSSDAGPVVASLGATGGIGRFSKSTQQTKGSMTPVDTVPETFVYYGIYTEGARAYCFDREFAHAFHMRLYTCNV